MSTYINIGSINNNNSRNLTINGNPSNVSDIVNSFFHDRQAEDIQAEEVKPQPKQPKPAKAKTDLPFLNLRGLEELGLYTLEEFTKMYREAAEGDAKTLAAFLKNYRDLKVFNFQGHNKKQVLEKIQAYFPTMKQYGYDNFVAYF